MTPYVMNKAMLRETRKAVSIFILMAFISTSVYSPAYAQLTTNEMPPLPAPGIMVNLSPQFTPAHLKGLVIHPENPLMFDFLITNGDEKLKAQEQRDTYQKLIKYFLASLAVPDENQWVNLSPYEKDRIIKDDFGKTEMGRDLLAEDYLLKQITASLIYPENNLGRKFWDKVYAQAHRQFGTTNIPVNTFNKVWIIPDSASVYEHGNMVYVVNCHLKVMLEEDYLSLKKHTGISMVTTQKADSNKAHALGSQVVREVVLPALEKEINVNKNFAMLRQVYSGMILAAWFKRALKESMLGTIYANKDKIKGVDQDPKINQEIYQRYLKAFKKGAFNYIKEDVDKYTKEAIPRKYFSGGMAGFMRSVEDPRTHKTILVDDWKAKVHSASLTAVAGDPDMSGLIDVSAQMNKSGTAPVANRQAMAMTTDTLKQQVLLQVRALTRKIVESGRASFEGQFESSIIGRMSIIHDLPELIDWIWSGRVLNTLLGAIGDSDVAVRSMIIDSGDTLRSVIPGDIQAVLIENDRINRETGTFSPSETRAKIQEALDRRLRTMEGLKEGVLDQVQLLSNQINRAAGKVIFKEGELEAFVSENMSLSHNLAELIDRVWSGRIVTALENRVVRAKLGSNELAVRSMVINSGDSFRSLIPQDIQAVLVENDRTNAEKGTFVPSETVAIIQEALSRHNAMTTVQINANELGQVNAEEIVPHYTESQHINWKGGSGMSHNYFDSTGRAVLFSITEDDKSPIGKTILMYRDYTERNPPFTVVVSGEYSLHPDKRGSQVPSAKKNIRQDISLAAALKLVQYAQSKTPVKIYADEIEKINAVRVGDYHTESQHIFWDGGNGMSHRYFAPSRRTPSFSITEDDSSPPGVTRFFYRDSTEKNAPLIIEMIGKYRVELYMAKGKDRDKVPIPRKGATQKITPKALLKVVQYARGKRSEAMVVEVGENIKAIEQPRFKGWQAFQITNESLTNSIAARGMNITLYLKSGELMIIGLSLKVKLKLPVRLTDGIPGPEFNADIMNAQNVKVENDNLIVTTSKERITFSTSRENPVTIVNLAMTIADTVGRLLKRPTHEVSEKFDDRFGDLAVEVFPARSRVVLTVDRGGDLQGLVQGAVEIANNLRASVQMRWQDNGEHSFNVRAEDTIRTVNQSVHPPVTGSLLAEVNQSLSRPTYGHVDEPAISFGNITAKVFSDHQRVLVENAQGDDINALLSNMVEIANFTGLTVQGSSHHGRYLYTAKYRDTILDVKMREAHAAMGAQSMAIPVAEHQADFGGIDFNAANLNLQIKRDGKGMPLPMTQQNWMNIRIDGLIPIIIDIRPASSLPVFLELQNSVKVVNG